VLHDENGEMRGMHACGRVGTLTTNNFRVCIDCQE
jgi:hypothetical protein